MLSIFWQNIKTYNLEAQQTFRILAGMLKLKYIFVSLLTPVVLSHSLPNILLIVHLDENSFSLNQHSKILWASNNSLPTTSTTLLSLFTGHLDKCQNAFPWLRSKDYDIMRIFPTTWDSNSQGPSAVGNNVTQMEVHPIYREINASIPRMDFGYKLL